MISTDRCSHCLLQIVCIRLSESMRTVSNRDICDGQMGGCLALRNPLGYLVTVQTDADPMPTDAERSFNRFQQRLTCVL